MKTKRFDVVLGGVQPSGMSRTVIGEVRVDTGNDDLDLAIVEAFENVAKTIYRIDLNQPTPPRARKR